MTPRTYASPEVFKQALEQRLRAAAVSGVEFARKRQLLVFDRFLARIADVFGSAATLKGGLALELPLERARTTKDVDLRMLGSPEQVLTRLQQAGRANLGDFMSFYGNDEKIVGIVRALSYVPHSAFSLEANTVDVNTGDLWQVRRTVVG